MRPTPAVTATPVLVAPAAGASAAAGAERIARFYAAHPTGRIITELVTRAREVVVFRALAYREADDAQPAATGWAAAGWGLGPSFERAEEVAVGRALANLGFGHGREARGATRADAADGVAPAPVVGVPNSGHVGGGEMAPAPAGGWPVQAGAAGAGAGDAGPGDAKPGDAGTGDVGTRGPHWAAGNDATDDVPTDGVPTDDAAGASPAAAGWREVPLGARDALAADLALLVARAERYGLRPRRAARWRARVAAGADTPAVLRVAEQRLRAWVERRRAEPYAGAV